MDSITGLTPDGTTGYNNTATPSNVNTATLLSSMATVDNLSETKNIKLENGAVKTSISSPSVGIGSTTGTTISMDASTISLRQRNSIEVLEKLDLMPHVQDLLTRVLSGNVLVKDVDNEAGSIRVKLAKAKSGLRELTGLNETIMSRRERINKLQLNIQQKQLLLQQFKRIIDQNQASQPILSPANERPAQTSNNATDSPVKMGPSDMQQDHNEPPLDVMDGQLNSIDQAMELDTYDDLTMRASNDNNATTRSSNEDSGVNGIKEEGEITNNTNQNGSNINVVPSSNSSGDTKLGDNLGNMTTYSLETMGINLESLPFDEDHNMGDI